MCKTLPASCLTVALVIFALSSLVLATDDVGRSEAGSLLSGDSTSADTDADTSTDPGPAGDSCEECTQIGDLSQLFVARSRRYRGNVFRMDGSTAVSEFAFELCIDEGVEVLLYFSIHGAPSGEQPFHRVTDDWVVPVIGRGCDFYWTNEGGGEPKDLVYLYPGNDYVFGVSWGDPPIAYGRNPSQHPGIRFPCFGDGAFWGSVSQAYLNKPFPPIDPDEEGVYMIPSSSGGPWSMKICQGGACCLSGGACTGEPDDPCCKTLVENACLTFGGIYTSPGVTCSEFEEDWGGCPPPDAACCGPDYSCVDTNPYVCDEVGGAWHGEGTCDQVGCLPTGACCLANATCLDDTLEDNCVAAGGNYRGDDSICGMVDPPCNAGACCLFDSGCDVQTEPQCDGMGGEFQGFGVPCDDWPPPCEPYGACCSGTSCYETTETECAAAGYSFRGDGSRCATIGPDCGFGACCTATIGCVDTSEYVCSFLPGSIYRGDGTTCDTIDPLCDGLCCWDGGCIDQMAPDLCSGLPGGVFAGYGLACPSTPTDPDPCISPPAACCLPTGACVDSTADACAGLNGDFDPQGDGSLCSGAACFIPPHPGACCMESGVCVDDVLAEDCAANGIYYHGDDTVCGPTDCLAGACCLAEGSCTDTIIELCDGLGDIFDPGNDCATAGCEACCLPNESCLHLTPALCAGLDGSDVGAGTQCSPLTDCTRGACCIGDQCEMLREAECRAADGDYQGEGVSCDRKPCIPLPTAVISSNPASGSTDARQPFELDGTGADGWDSLVLEFDADAKAVTPAEFSVEIVTGTCPTNGFTPSVSIVTPVGNFVTLRFDDYIPYGAWTQVTYVPSGQSVCLGYLPGDADGSRTSDPSDILAVIDCINGVAVTPCLEFNTDIDRSGPPVDPSDIIRVIDLLNGAGSFDAWFGCSLPPSPCAPRAVGSNEGRAGG